MDAIDAAREVYEQTRDALKLAEQAKPYIDGEQWAVAAVIFMRRETARTLRNACGGPDQPPVRPECKRSADRPAGHDFARVRPVVMYLSGAVGRLAGWMIYGPRILASRLRRRFQASGRR